MFDPPVINFLGAIGIGVVIGVIGAVTLKAKNPNATWMAPVLAIAGALVASILALFFGDDRDYGWKEPILQVVLAAAGVGLTAFLGSNKSTAASTQASE